MAENPNSVLNPAKGLPPAQGMTHEINPAKGLM